MVATAAAAREAVAMAAAATATAAAATAAATAATAAEVVHTRGTRARIDHPLLSSPSDNSSYTSFCTSCRLNNRPCTC